MNLTSRALCWEGLPVRHQRCGKEPSGLAPASPLPFPPPQRCPTSGRALTGAFSGASVEIKVRSIIRSSAVVEGKRMFRGEPREQGWDGMGWHVRAASG